MTEEYLPEAQQLAVEELLRSVDWPQELTMAQLSYFYLRTAQIYGQTQETFGLLALNAVANMAQPDD